MKSKNCVSIKTKPATCCFSDNNRYATMMKRTIFLVLFLLTGVLTNAQKTNPNYDEALAKKLGADDFGMKNYVFVILKTGENMTTDKEELNKLFRGHMENIQRLVDEKKLIVAGPFGENDKTWRGLFILDVKTVEEAAVLVQTDPAIKAGIFDVDLVPWYGSAALPEYLPASDKIWKAEP
ncbi:MAG: YciI family protein [Draconibacterium sp.]